MQKRLQLRIEAQGKYLQSVLKKAQETLSGFNSSPIGIQFTKDELSQLVVMINNVCPSSSISELSESRGLSLECGKRKPKNGTMCSLESSLTSSESSNRKEEKNSMEEIGDFKNFDTDSLELPLSTKRSKVLSVSCQCSCLMSSSVIEPDESSNGRRCGNKLKKGKLSEMLDLNSQFQNDMDSSHSTSSKALLLDLNCSLNTYDP